MPDYKANAKNTNNGASFSPGKCFNFGSGRPTNAKWVTDGECKHLDDLEENGKRSEVWEYKYPYGKCLVIGTYHPSSREFSSAGYSPLIKKFLSMKL